MSKDGTITAGVQTGTCYVYAKAHNGVTKRVRVKVKNYARPKEFYYNNPYNWRITTLLNDYKEEICNIASYYTINNVGTDNIINIYLDNHAEIVTIPEDAKIDKEILEDIKKILVYFPTEINIRLSGGMIRFMMYDNLDEMGCFEAVDYRINDDCRNADYQIASHWKAWDFVPD